MALPPLLHTYKRFKSLRSHRISALPIIILMPHSACNCRCVMCDIWKGNKNAQQLREEDILSLLDNLKKLQTKRVLMSGGEALLNKNFFRFCEILTARGMKITLLSTGLTLARHAQSICENVDEVIVSLDGDENKHDEIRNIKGAFSELRNGVHSLKKIRPDLMVRARSVIHRHNFRVWENMVDAALDLKLDSISFLPADVSSEAFNRPDTWDKERQDTVLISKSELPDLLKTIEDLVVHYQPHFERGFIVESADKIKNIYSYYAAQHGLNPFPYKQCNAPWVSAVVEADGAVRPCFFHDKIGNIRQENLLDILNASENINYRKQLNIQENQTCVKCVCSLNLSPLNNRF